MNRRFSFWFLITFIFALLVLFPRFVSAQANIEITPEEPEYTFGDQISFGASLTYNDQIDEILLFIQTGDDSDLQVHPVSLDEFGHLTAQVDLREYPLAGYANITYWYQVNTPKGETFTSKQFSFDYVDNRFQWRSLSGDPFTIHWYRGDLVFGEEVLNVSLEGLRTIQDLLAVFFPQSMDVYVYDSVQALQSALPNGGQNWLAGHANPDGGVILVSLPPGPEQRLEMERQIPHELMHIGLSYTDSHAYSNLPTWFNEGLASLVELYPNPEYQVLIDNAYESDQLLPFTSLCHSFPTDAGHGLQAYAQSASFTQYLYDRFGEPGFNRLIAAYASGMSCESGVEQALGTDLTGLESGWRRENFTDLTIARTYQEFLPWLVLLVVILAGPVILAISILRRRTVRADI
jgi:hypothetical protein